MLPVAIPRLSQIQVLITWYSLYARGCIARWHAKGGNYVISPRPVVARLGRWGMFGDRIVPFPVVLISAGVPY